MPTIGVGRDALFACLGKTFTEDEFQAKKSELLARM